MDNNQQQRAAQGHGSLIRPEQVSRLPQLNAQQKQQYEQHVRKLWEVMNAVPQGDQRQTEAYNKLVQTSQTLMAGMKNFQQMAQQQKKREQMVAAQAAQAASTGQPAQAGQQAQQAGGQTQGQASGNATMFNQLYQGIQDKVNGLVFYYPTAMVEGTKQADDWLREAKARYGQALQRLQVATTKYNETKTNYSQRQASGQMQPQEEQSYRTRMSQCQKAIQESQNFMEKFRNQQNEFRAQQPQNQFQKQASQQGQGAAVPMSAGGTQQTAQGPPAYSISDAVSAARNQQAQAAETGQASVTPTNANAPQQPNPAGASATPVKTENQEQSAFASQAQASVLNNSLPQSASARPSSQPQSALQQHASQQNIHAHPLSQNLNVTKAPQQAITKNLQVTEPRPVSMPPSRPTMSGGAGVGMPGSMSQPAIPQLPGYVLEHSEDGRVLGRKKLNELLREVVGPGIGGEEQFMSADAEEVRDRPLPCHLFLAPGIANANTRLPHRSSSKLQTTS
jgi:transcription initiation factor TFIID subunit 12